VCKYVLSIVSPVTYILLTFSIGQPGVPKARIMSGTGKHVVHPISTDGKRPPVPGLLHSR
jgi:hypothetical protein